ncbi:discoidin domain-containing protein [Asticcacaulis sp. AND118]|uniref:discoidin domain-containing protein n=1 Tax=Asticcacaulis sp. AND118 TaxID=2840468 RepID=UPI001CFFDD06|nr:discoidin domain-containing protein [Asticcacaulis sp. AND118]UDF05011.1 discoidin domain-containing protein [Asticcacaulis sp. AND118]
MSLHLSWTALILAAGLLATPLAAQTVLIAPTPWTAGASEGVSSKASGTQTARLDYGFKGAGYAFMVHDLDFAAPENFVIEIPVKGEGAGNDLQIKFTDASGDNVWWVTRPAFVPTPQGTVLRIRPRHVEFAWGTTQDRGFRGGKRMEVVVVKTAKGAGSGWLEVGPIRWRAEAPEPKTEAPLKADVVVAVDGKAQTGAQAAAVTLDLSRVRAFGGVRLDWGRAPARYTVAVSDDGRAFRDLRTVEGSDGGADYVTLGEVDARYVRITGPGQLNEAALLPLDMGVKPNALLSELARQAPRGDYPRGFSEQAYWTVVGVAHGGPRAALLSEDGAVELGPERPSLVPLLKIDGKRVTWAQASVKQVMDAERLPLPSVEWQAEGVQMRVAPVAFGDGKAPYALARYDVRSDTAQTVRLELHLQPMQVNPPTQFLTRPGGYAPIRTVTREGDTVQVDDQPLWLLTPPRDFTASGFLSGAQGAKASDTDGLASGVIGYDLSLKAGETQSVIVAFPLGGQTQRPAMSGDPVQWADTRREAVRADWRKRLGETRLILPDGTPPIADSARLALAYQLILLDGDWLKPGARSYDRSWIRDGAMMSEGLLRMGLQREALAYFKAYAPMSFDNGKVPCCVDARGADPTPENDSHGELAWLAGELIRFGVNPSEIAPYWPQVSGAITYQEGLRQQNLTPQTEARYRGMMPPSISHEGYSDKAAYSYWDNFWALKGYRGAAVTAQALGKTEDAKRIAAQGEAFGRDLTASILATAAHYQQDVVAGAADRGDFDPTSTTMGLTSGAHTDDIPEALKRQTFERYWNEKLMPRRQTPNSYTPYELRNVGAFLRLKQPDRARQALDMFFADQAPKDWFQWGEVITVPYRQPLFIGDLPHGWVESDYLRVALDMFAYERAETSQMVLLSGFDPKWADKGETRLEKLHTPWGLVSLKIVKAGKGLKINIDSTAAPPGGYVIDVPSLMGPKATVVVDGNRATLTDGELILKAVKAEIVLGGGA